MKNVLPSQFTISLRLALVSALLLVCRSVLADVSFSVTPASISDQYTGPLTFQISGLTNGEPVRIGKYFDANTNGVIDGQDLHVFGTQVTDGKAMVIGGVTNINVPGDWDTNPGSIQFQLSFPASGIEQRFVGTYNYVLLSPGGRFAPIRSSLTITNSAYGQSISGAVRCDGTNVPYAGVLLFGEGSDSPAAGAVANASGNYSLQIPPGTYQVWAFQSNYVADMGAAPGVRLGIGETQTADLELLPATCSLSGQYVYPTLTQGISGLLVVCQSTSGQIALGFTDTNGNFTVPVVPGEWEISNDSQSLAAYGLVRSQSDPDVVVTSGTQTMPAIVIPGGGVQFFGTVTDDLGRPLTGVRVSAGDDGEQYEAEATTDQDGYYVMLVKGGGWNIGVSSDSPEYEHYILPGYTHTNVSGGQSVPMNFRGLLATNHISGYVRDGTNGPIAGLEVWCRTASPINGFDYQARTAYTDATGYYSFNVANGTWTVEPACDGNPGLNQLGYPCVSPVNVVVANNNPLTNFIAQVVATQISGYVRDGNSNPVAQVELTAWNGMNTYINGATDESGHYVLGVSNGNWQVSLLCCGSNSLSQLGYLCVDARQTNVFNNTVALDFAVPSAPFRISGYLRDGSSGNPIPNVHLYLNSAADYLSLCPATTDGAGYYSFFVTNGTWNLNVDCAELNALGYTCRGNTSVAVSGANVSTNLTTLPAPFELSGWLKDQSGNPITNMSIYAYASIDGVSFWLGASTDNNGNYSHRLAPGLWHIGVNCGGGFGLLSRGYQCVEEQTVSVSSNSVLNFAAGSSSPLQLTTTTLPDASQNTFYSASLTAAGGQPPYSWSLAPGSASLPSYLALSTNGVISGTPTGAGTGSFIVRVTDAAAASMDRVLTLTVLPSMNPPVVVLTAPRYVAGGQFQFTLNTVAELNYTLEVSADLSAWAPVLTFTGSGGPLTLGDATAAGAGRRFYRVKAGP